jgi:hypothetical protein
LGENVKELKDINNLTELTDFLRFQGVKFLKIDRKTNFKEGRNVRKVVSKIFKGG